MFSITRSASLHLLLTWTMCPVVGFQGPKNLQHVLIKPDPAVQTQIRAAVDATSELDICREVLKLREIAQKDDRHLFQQLVYFASHGRDVREGMAIYIGTDVLKLSETTVIDAITPFLGTEDDRLNQVLQKVLKRIENANGRQPDFSFYLEYLRLHKTKLPEALVEHMYNTSPATALLTLMAIYVDDAEAKKPILWGEHVVSDVLWKQHYGFLRPEEIEAPAAEQLDKLSRSDEWWVRLYVAEIIKQHPEFQTPELNARLKADQNPVVRKAVSRKPTGC